MANDENTTKFQEAMEYFKASQSIIDKRKPTKIEKMVIKPLDPKSMVETIGTTANEMDALRYNFKQLVPDFGESLIDSKGSFSLNLCAHVLYTAGPRKKGDKTERTDKYWEYEILNEDLKTESGYPSFFVYSFMSEENDMNIPSSAFSLKKASLLMIETLDTVIDYLEVKYPYGEDEEVNKKMQEKHAILTPLAAAAFSKQTVLTLANSTAHKREAGTFGTVATWCKIINASCAGGGHLLKYSDGTIAAAAAMNATKNLADKKLAESIVGKVVKQYAAAGKPFDNEFIAEMLKTVNGGWPSGWTYDKLLETQDRAKLMTPMDAAKIQAMTAKMAYAVAPNTNKV